MDNNNFDEQNSLPGIDSPASKDGVDDMVSEDNIVEQTGESDDAPVYKGNCGYFSGKNLIHRTYYLEYPLC